MAKDNVSQFIEQLETELSARFVVSTNDKPYLTCIYEGENKTFLINTQKFISFVYKLCADLNIEMPTEYDIKKIKAHCISRCHSNGLVSDYYVRVYSKNDKNVISKSEIIIDMCSNDPSYVVINSEGFSVVKSCQVPFLRPAKQLALLSPVNVEKEVFLKEFKKIWNLKNESDWLLILAYIVKSIWRDFGAYPFLIFCGEKGTGKSTASRQLKMLIDPTLPETLSPPRNDDGINALTSNSYLLAFDNLSYLSADMADCYCRMSTGGGNSKRSLYSDDDESSYNTKRPLLFNGIDELTNRTDFIDRSISIATKKIENYVRTSDAELSRLLEASYPILTGGIYGLTSKCIAIFEDIPKTNLPRMTEYAQIGIAIERVLGLPDGQFMTVYEENLKNQIEDSFWTDDICMLVYSFLKSRNRHKESYFNCLAGVPKSNPGSRSVNENPFLIGTPTEIKNSLDRYNVQNDVDLKSRTTRFQIPKDTASLFKAINRRLDNFRGQGIVVADLERTSKERKKIIGFKADVERYFEIMAATKIDPIISEL